MSSEICAADANNEDCSCYNIINRDCDAEPDIPGCKENIEWKDEILKAIPDKPAFANQKAMAERELKARYHCGGRACPHDKYRPPEYHDLAALGRCNVKLNICSSNVTTESSIAAKYFRDCSINNIVAEDMDAWYSTEDNLQTMTGIRTSENAAYIAAKNKKLQLAIRAKDREAAADRQATQDAGWAAHKDTLEDVKDMHQRDEENKKRLLYILIAVGILMTILILNV